MLSRNGCVLFASRRRHTSGALVTGSQTCALPIVQWYAFSVPVYSEGHCRWAEKEDHWTKRRHLPLSRAGDGQVDLVLVGQYFEQQRGRGELVLAARPAEVAADRIAGP